MEYNFSQIEAKWRDYWTNNQTFKAENASSKPKYYVLDMFPYPSGSGLHVGHPLGYIASDIYARYKRHQGFNVLHPMGYDAFGLPAEQYAIQTGQHPSITTEQNIKRYREQLDLIGFSFDWNRQVNTSNPDYYKWTQWIFVQLFHSWYSNDTNKAEPIETLINTFEKEGNGNVNAVGEECDVFSAESWASFSPEKQRELLLKYRLAYRAETIVNWCEELGTVLANDEVVNGVSERGGYPVVQRKMKQWSLRITAYAQRLLDGLDNLEWTDSLKEIQRNWIGRSQGAEITFKIDNHTGELTVFSTRPDTIYGATFMVLAPEHELVKTITTEAQAKDIEDYLTYVKGRSERDRMSETKNVTGAFTGAYAINPVNGEKIPIWVADYVLAGYGTGAVMAVPAGDQRDWDFATKFSLPIIPIIEGQDVSEGADDRKDGIIQNSGFLNGLNVEQAVDKVISFLEEEKVGVKKINYKIRDAVFSRQRYWGEPFPVYYIDDVPYTVDEDKLPLTLPEIDAYKPTKDGDPPLGRAEVWKWDNTSGQLTNEEEGHPIELSTMPGWAGSSWYFLRYMMEGDAEKRSTQFVSKEAASYWKQVDLYVGGAEHATGHLLYFRFWTKFLFDRGFISIDEPARKLINQGMIQAEDGQKMSKRYGNVVNPDDVIAEHGADALRLHEMFLGPIEMHKPWNTKGIEGVSKFMRKLWRLYHTDGKVDIVDTTPSKAELKALHKCIQKVTEDMDRFSFNTSVSAFMVAVNELSDLKCNKKAVLSDLAVLVSCHAPHIAEELWSSLGHNESISEATWPMFNAEYVKDDNVVYPVSFNGKTRFRIEVPATMSKEEVEKVVLADEQALKWTNGNAPRKVIVVPGRIVNIVI